MTFVKEDIPSKLLTKHNFFIFILFFFLSGFSLTHIHESLDRRGSERVCL